jgi:transposase-like protein
MTRHRTHSIQFKRQIVQEYFSGESLHGLARRYDIARNLIRIWIRKYEEGAFDEDVEAVDLIQEYEARIAALERLVGKQALELEFLKGALKNTQRPKKRLHPSSPARRPLHRRRMPADGDRALDLL